jgi:hypothetical protein
MIKEILVNNKLVALIIRSSYKSEGINFFTPNDFSQQLGYMNRPKNYVIAPHLHNYVPRNISFTKEVLFIKSGKVRVDFYDDDKNYLESYILYAGDVILLAYGGHGFKMLEPTEMIEVKQGPYAADQDKNRFEAVDDEKLKIKY